MSLSCGRRQHGKPHFCSITKRSSQAKKWNRTFCCEIATSSSFHASKQKTHVQTAPIHRQQTTTNEADRGDDPRSCEIEWFVGFLSLGVTVLTVLCFGGKAVLFVFGLPRSPLDGRFAHVVSSCLPTVFSVQSDPTTCTCGGCHGEKNRKRVCFNVGS